MRQKKGQFPYQIAIPSYNRAETLRDKTLAMLKSYRIPADHITVFVADGDQKKLYKETLVPGTYGSIVVGIKGLMEVRNFISDYYPIGTPLVCFDDDLKGFIEYTEETARHEKPLRSLLGVIKRGFEECIKHGASLWGVYPSPNGYFMKPTVSTDLKICIGSAWGCINPGTKGSKGVKLTMSEKEDYERSLLYYLRDGHIIRLNFVSPLTAYFKEPGGLQEGDRKKRMRAAVDTLVKRYPDYIVENPRRKSGYAEILFRKQKKSDDEQESDKN